MIFLQLRITARTNWQPQSGKNTRERSVPRTFGNPLAQQTYTAVVSALPLIRRTPTRSIWERLAAVCGVHSPAGSVGIGCKSRSVTRHSAFHQLSSILSTQTPSILELEKYIGIKEHMADLLFEQHEVVTASEF